ncbi:MAG: exodeoxyribonuclease VII large subunit [Candidatus Baltobacteraceae bacterium]
MSQVVPAQPKVWGVRELVNYLKRAFAHDRNISELGVRGELTDHSRSGFGHVYFGLKEPNGAVLKCFVRSTYVPDLPPLENGLEATAFGSLGLFEGRSQYQLVVTSVQLVGAGRLAAAYEKIKRKLEAEGLFDGVRKRPIPRYPFRVALVSSPEAEGARDFLTILRAKAPQIGVRLVATSVQGQGAADSIARALAQAGRLDVDVVVLARGGGSDEDRLPFNDESVARAIAASRVPVVTAIGHQGDHHIADDVADREAATPTAAAELLVAGFSALPQRLRDSRARLRSSLQHRIDERGRRLERAAGSAYLQRFERISDVLSERVDRLLTGVVGAEREVIRRNDLYLRELERRLGRYDPRAQLAARATRVAGLREALGMRLATRLTTARRDANDAARTLESTAAARLQGAGHCLALWTARLEGKNPEKILQQGYAIVRHGGRVVSDAGAVAAGDLIEAQFSRGTLAARVEATAQDG